MTSLLFMGNIIKPLCFIFFSFSLLTAETLKLEPASWIRETRRLDLKNKTENTTKDQRKKRALKQFRRSDIIFFISLPFTYMASAFVIAPQEVDYFNSTIARARGAFTRDVFLDPYKHIFNSGIFFIWVNSFLWSAVISFNDFYQNVGFSRWKTNQKDYSINQLQFSFFHTRF